MITLLLFFFKLQTKGSSPFRALSWEQGARCLLGARPGGTSWGPASVWAGPGLERGCVAHPPLWGAVGLATGVAPEGSVEQVWASGLPVGYAGSGPS